MDDKISKIGGLTVKQILFCKEYLIDNNAKASAIRAGYSPRSAMQMGHRTLRHPRVQARIKKELAKQSRRVEITADRVMKEIAKLAFIDITKFFDKNGTLKDVADFSDDAAAAVASVEVIRQVTGRDEDPEYLHKIRLWDKAKALEMLAKHFNLLGDYDKDKGDTYITQIINSFNIEDQPAVDATLGILEDNMRRKQI